MNLKLQNAAPARGARWVRQGFGVFFKRPVACSALFAGFIFALLMLLLVPWIGSLLVMMALPLGTIGFMIATQIVLQGKLPLATVFAAPLLRDKVRRNEQIKLGLAYALASFIVMLLADMIDGGRFDALEELLSNGQSSQEQIQAQLSDPMLEFGMLVRLGLTGLLAIPFWHAPALIHWGGHMVGKALFSSTVAVWRNRGAFAVYGVTWVGVVLLFGIVATLVFTLLGHPELVAVAALPAGLIFSTAFYTSLYFSFADCFAPTGPKPLPEPEEPPPPEATDAASD